MTVIKMKDSNRCPHKMQCMYPGGVIMAYEDHCRLAVDHEGFHRGEHGTVWDNKEKRLQGWEPPAKQKVFLAK
jgi:hypothetical protein